VIVRLARVTALAVVCIASPSTSALAQQACPPGTDSIVAAGWAAFRADSIALAASHFDAALARCPSSHDALAGHAYTLLRGGSPATADSIFRALTLRVPGSTDAWEGLAASAERMGDRSRAVDAWKRLIAIAPDRADARAQLDRLAPGWDRAATPLVKHRAAELDLTLRTRGEGFELLRDGRWRPFFIKGVNMGLALPGRFPSEFPTDSALYARWLGQISAMHANALRLYTILPPEFYRALRAHNLTHPGAELYLVHGVWTELPPRNDFSDAAFNAGFADEIRRVVDLLHGAAEFAAQPGHAGGRYDADVSKWTIAYVLGREWEPYSVEGYDADPSAPRKHLGRHLTLTSGTATEAWMVRMCDLLLTYEDETYNAQRPIAYTNWPTTDPIKHPTEVSYEQQMKWRGLTYRRDPGAEPIHEEESVSLDPSRVQRTARNVAGWFASYHVYPYYPDFLIHDPGYARASSSLGRSNYFGYLQDLRRVHRGIPLLVAEFGVPTSRGSAHLQPQGMDHGGLSEQQAAAIDVRLAKEIRESGAAGAIVFAWIDEWFKKNWFIAEFERPAERGRLWHNMGNPEEHYGMVALRPGVEGKVPLPGGPIAPWQALAPLQRGRLLGTDSVTMRVGSDEGFVYVALESAAWRARAFPWDATRLQLAIDTHGATLGQGLLPTSGLFSQAGFEFLVELNGPADAQLRVLPEYSPYRSPIEVESGEFYGEPFRRPLLSVRREDGVFDTLYALLNRPRYIAEGRKVRGVGRNVGRLRYGRAQDDSNADWWYDAASGMVQLRLPWGLLNVADPSSRRVMTESDPEQALGRRPGAPPSQRASVATEGFRFAAVAWRPGPDVLGTIPALDAQGHFTIERMPLWTWPTWETPTWHEYLKPAYRALQQYWAAP